MNYISTRGQVDPISFSKAVMMGLATDGGLLLPQQIPFIDKETLRRWSALSFQELAIEVMKPFIGDDLPEAELTDLVRRSYATFNHPEITPLVNFGSFRILELFHGPTLAFKDIALQFLGNLFEYFLKRDGGQLNILGATSGDTGSAAIHGVRGKERMHIFILHPHKRVSLVQERQMVTVMDKNVHNIAVRGTFDDGQRIVKHIFGDLEFKQHYSLGAVNSINWARILAQVVYFFYAWGRVCGGDIHKKVTFSVPTGNFGDIFAGFVAWRMGLPVERLILATNRNDILTRFVHTGIYQSGTVLPTFSPSMDIQVSSNFERFLYYLLDESADAVRERMTEFTQTGRFSIPEGKLGLVREIFAAQAVSETQTIERIQKIHAAHGYLLDPHTAVGVEAASLIDGAICLATAHPAKFGNAVEKALGHSPQLPPALVEVMQPNRPVRCQVMEADEASVKAFMVEALR
ncbi:MAG: threonine synthase [Magnetococcus sp. DMHC-6]